jgi:hypothetical protein
MCLPRLPKSGSDKIPILWKPSIVWNVTQRRLVVGNRHFETSLSVPFSNAKQYPSCTVWPLKMELTEGLETSETNY